MRSVLQRVKKASVSVDNKLINKINNGFLIYLGLASGDTREMIDKFITKVLKLRIFADQEGKTNLDIFSLNKPEILLISQFTLMANTNLGNRPSFTEAMPFSEAKELYEYVLLEFNKRIPTFGGVFGADMEIDSINDGPFTLILEDRND